MDRSPFVGRLARKDHLADDGDNVGPVKGYRRDTEDGLGSVIAGQVQQTQQSAEETDQPDSVDWSSTPGVDSTPEFGEGEHAIAGQSEDGAGT